MERGAKYKNGFTLIEAVLVLAVAGLIFAIVFTSLPALQVSSRDTTRETDILNLIAKIKDYQTNNRGALPSDTTYVDGDEFDACDVVTGNCNAYSDAKDTTWRGFYRDYLGIQFMDPLGEHYSLSIVECGTGVGIDKPCTNAKLGQLYESRFPYENYDILIVKGATCYGSEAVGASNPRMIAAVYKLEGAGTLCYGT